MDLTATMDQYGALLEQQATVMGQYYRTMVKEGIPHQVADVIIRDWAWVFLCKAHWPNDPPNPPGY